MSSYFGSPAATGARDRILKAGNSFSPWEPIRLRFFVIFVAFCWVPRGNDT